MKKKNHLITMRPSQGFWETGEKGIYFRGNRVTKAKFEGNRGTKRIFGKREHKKEIFVFWGTGDKPIYFRRTREQVPPGMASTMFEKFAFELKYMAMQEMHF